LHRPQHQWLAITKSIKNMRRDARLMRRVVSSPTYQRLLRLLGADWTWSPDQNELDYYATTVGGHRISITADTNVTGAGADTIIIDDPHDARDVLGAPEQIAEHMDGVWERYEEVWSRRLNPPGGRVQCIMQRLHEQDMAGRLLDGGARAMVLPFAYEVGREDVWESDPRTEEGEILAPGRFGEAELADGQKSPQVWAGQMQQRPVAKEGGLFKAGWFEGRWSGQGGVAQIVVSVDCTFKDTKSSDYVGIGDWARFRETVTVALLGVMNERWDYPTLKARLREHVAELRVRFPGVPLIVLVEDKANGSALIADLRTEIPAILAFEPGAKSKYERAQVGSAPMMEAGQVLLVEAGWTRLYIAQHTSFPKSRHDDLVDMSSQACIYMAQHPLQPPGAIRHGGPRRDMSERGEEADRDRTGTGRRGGGGGRRSGW
jgi:predicted phage terminase large subunit-like protein